MQRTEYGFCYSFNSEMAELPREAPRRDRYGESRPRRASGYGEWSGVKVTIHLGNITRPPDSGEHQAGSDGLRGARYGETIFTLRAVDAEKREEKMKTGQN